MADKRILKVICDAIEELNTCQDEDEKLELSEDTKLFGSNSKLDSIGFVNFIVDVEQRVNDTFDTDVILMDEKAMSLKNSPFKDVKALTEYIETLLGGQENG